MKVKYCYTLFLFFISTFLVAQNDLSPQLDSNSVNRTRLIGVIGVESLVYGSSVIGLSKLWYEDYTSFHFFNDNNQWKQMDKVGHAFSSYTIGRYGMDILDWTGIKHKKAIWIGSNIATLALLTVETFDGFSEDWGASPGDMVANISGTAMLISQELIWEEQRIVFKYSFHPSSYAKHRPELLGSNFSEQMLKDYNGQTYWLSGNVSSFSKKETKLPKWLNVAFGYGADALVGGENNLMNDTLINENQYRQYYLSLDVDFTRIKTSSKVLKTFFRAINIFKVPFPAIYMSKEGLKFKALYF
ncbi:MAG: DUF2279 domain-containing protein [Flavobacteriales bacterium]|nr:DUF2279 domain-containing protein [Flavobacteriales bacterium]